MRAAILVVGAAITAAGCDKPPGDRVLKSETTIHHRGERPWILLRYDIAEGFEQQTDVVVDMEMQTSGAAELDVTLPRLTSTERFTVDKVDDKGGMHVVAETTAIDVGDDGDGAAEVRRALTDLMGMGMSMTLQPDGSQRGMRVDLSSVPAGARDQARQIEQTLDQVVAKLPDVPVGVGARWTTEQTVRLSGMKVFYTFDYEVLEISEERALLHVDYEVTAPPQTLVTPQGSARLNAMIGEGPIELELDLRAVTGRADMDVNVSMAMSAAGQLVDLDMSARVQVLPHGETPEPRRSRDAD